MGGMVATRYALMFPAETTALILENPIGLEDWLSKGVPRTAIGRNNAPPELAEKLGNYPELGRATDAAIPDSKLVEIDGIGHLPHIKAFPRFIEPLKEFLAQRAQR